MLTGPLSVSALVEEFPLSRSALSEHLAVLRNADLVRDVPHGQQRLYHLVPDRLREIDEWLSPFESYWRDRLSGLRDMRETEEQ